MFIAAGIGLLVQQRDVLSWGRRGNGAQIRVNVREIRVRENLSGIGGHLAGGMTDIGCECDENDWPRGEPRTGDAALSLVAVALVAADFNKKALALFGIGGERQILKYQGESSGEENLVHVCRGYHRKDRGARLSVRLVFVKLLTSVVAIIPVIRIVSVIPIVMVVMTFAHIAVVRPLHETQRPFQPEGQK